MTKTKDLHLLAFYVIKPKDPKRTGEKGYMTNPENHRYDERIEFTRGLNPKDQTYAGVILNLAKKTVIANRYGALDGNFDRLFKYFLEGYPEYVIQVMAQLDLPYLEQFIPKEEDKAIESEVSTQATSEETTDAKEVPSA
jgi:hypothetical protein